MTSSSYLPIDKSPKLNSGADIARVLRSFSQLHLGHHVSNAIHQERLEVISRTAGRRYVDTAALELSTHPGLVCWVMLGADNCVVWLLYGSQPPNYASRLFGLSVVAEDVILGREHALMAYLEALVSRGVLNASGKHFAYSGPTEALHALRMHELLWEGKQPPTSWDAGLLRQGIKGVSRGLLLCTVVAGIAAIAFRTDTWTSLFIASAILALIAYGVYAVIILWGMLQH
jgi:hypothetical protein